MTGIDQSVQRIREQVKLWCRRIVAGAFVFVFLVAAISLLISASRIALEDQLGPIGSRLLVAFVLCVLSAGVLLWAWKAANSPVEARKRDSILDVIVLGYTLAQELKAALGVGEPPRKSAKAKAEDPPNPDSEKAA
ncbi:hypothetical protein GJW-30_1_02355 [Variibacter gotjawalensis]|uniref:Holin-X, holin superfamily III n=1 Tax=Variibacter gotjawalensis TaxID=1333996 RepID=A0A0S3PV84_9BRAD|nr:hypothetical protein [Variibacter gotjawalensis]NIK50148.1 hypothetical protein [Variibacter gotjawalensis]RZS46144.1 hypothetical protein EV661_4475 [Variibacter gotjawalensis]BAT59821.1 hypothetical protein GJW-30_1_02355 [Variibacter gotjawalensis]